MADVLEKLRGEICEVDNQILKLVNQRLQLAKEIGEIKRKHGLPLIDLNVEKAVLERALIWSREIGLDQNFTSKLINMLIAESVRVQESSSRDRTKKLPKRKRISLQDS